MARKNHRKQYHSHRLSVDLFRLTKRKPLSPNKPAHQIEASPSVREKDKHMENTATLITSTSILPRPIKPQGTDDPRIVRGSVWFADLAPRSTSNLIPTSVQTGTRPVLVISNDLNNRYGTVLTVVPFTGAPKRLDMPTHVAVIPSDVRNGYMPSEIYTSTLLAEQVTALDKACLVSYVGTVVSQDLMSRVEAALLTQVGISQIRQEQGKED